MPERARAATAGASPAAIEHHYDVGDAFYRCWLGPRMVYSAALFEEGEGKRDLDRAQERKLRFHADAVRASGSSRVLDVGCGWGAMLAHLAERAGVPELTGLTLSRSQHRAVEAQARPGWSVRLESWTEHQPPAAYSGIISIGAFEHFARPDMSGDEKIAVYRSFFARCWRWLEPGGRLSLQTIAYGNLRPRDASRFIQEAVFPESELPTLGEIAAALEGRFEVELLRNDRSHYALTCQAWLERLRRHRRDALAAAGEATYRRYVDYLKYSIFGFRLGKLQLLRWVLARIDEPVAAPER